MAMARSYVKPGVLLSLLALAACGADSAEQGRSNGALATRVASQSSAAQSVRACEIVDLATAAQILGPGAEHPGGDTEELTCIYSSPGVALLTVQLGDADLYDQITILPPHTSVDIGDRGRYNIQETGAIAVQFAKGAYSVTLGVQPIGAGDGEFLEPLLSVAREVAGRLP